MKSHRWFLLICANLATCLFADSARAATAILVSVPDQKMALMQDGVRTAQFPVSTSRYGVGDRPRSFATPLGTLEIASKIGAAAPLGAVFKGRAMTGEILPPDALGRDPIVTRILWLRGLEACNSNAFGRAIYIHGTPVERQIGRPASYGCIRMRSRDVVTVFNAVPVGTKIQIVNKPLSRAVAESALAFHLSRPTKLAAN